LVDATTSRLSPGEEYSILLEQLYSAFLPWVLMLAHDDGWIVPPQEEDRVLEIQFFKDVFFGRQVKHNVV
jgi:hypothetical protein